MQGIWEYVTAPGVGRYSLMPGALFWAVVIVHACMKARWALVLGGVWIALLAATMLSGLDPVVFFVVQCLMAVIALVAGGHGHWRGGWS